MMCEIGEESSWGFHDRSWSSTKREDWKTGSVQAASDCCSVVWSPVVKEGANGKLQRRGGASMTIRAFTVLQKKRALELPIVSRCETEDADRHGDQDGDPSSQFSRE
jgi:hypothetical protein